MQDRGPWRIDASPNPGIKDRLYGAVAIHRRDAWAVGRFVNQAGISMPLIGHWDGTRWRTAASRAPDSVNSYLFGVAALPHSPDVWAVGATADLNLANDQTLIEHFDGARWRVKPSPTRGVLAGVSARSPDDVWAVGEVGGDTGVARTLVEHWDGSRWSVVSSPNPGRFGDTLAAVTALSPTDVWAAGTARTAKYNAVALIEHWNGRRWRPVPTPPVGDESDLRAIAAVSANDIWAVGVHDLAFTLTEHWDGGSWHVVPSPSPTNDCILQGVTALSSNDVWAVGSMADSRPLTMQWNGTGWTIVSSPQRHAALSSLAAVSADSHGRLWAAGFEFERQTYAYHTLIEQARLRGST